MVCAIELGLMQPSTGESETNESKSGWPKRRTTNIRTASRLNNSVSTGSTLMRHEINSWLIHDELDQRIKREDYSQNHLPFLDHRYALPAVSSYPENFNPAKTRNVYYNGENDQAEKTVVYNPFNALRDWSAKSNYVIENQSTTRQPNDLSNDADNEAEDLPKKPFFRKQHFVTGSSLGEYLSNEKKDKMIRRITPKQRYFRYNQGNTLSLQTNEQTNIALEICSEQESKPKISVPTVAPQSSEFKNISGPDIFEFNRTINEQESKPRISVEKVDASKSSELKNISGPDIYEFNCTINEQESKPKISLVFNNVPDIYEFNRSIKNQTGPLSAISSSDDSSENEHRSVEDFPKDRSDIDATYSKESCTNFGEKMQIATVKTLHSKRQYYRDLFWSRANKENRNTEKISGKAESEKENRNISEKIFQEENKNRNISEKILQEENKNRNISEKILQEEKKHRNISEKILQEEKKNRNISGKILQEEKKHRNISEKILQEAKKHRNTSEKILQEKENKVSLFCNVKSPNEKSFPRENITVDIADPPVGYEDSEDETLLVNPFTDLPGSLLESDDQNIQIIDLHPQFNVDFDMNFEHDSTTLNGCLDREDVTKELGEISPSVEEESKMKENYLDKYVTNTKMKKILSPVERPKKRRSADSLVKSNSSEDKPKNNDKNSNNITVNNSGRITRGSMKNCVKNETNDRKWKIGTVVWGKCMGWWPGLIVDAEDVGMCESEGKTWIYWISEHRISHLRDKTQIEYFSAGLRNRMIETFRVKTPKDANYAACLATVKLINDQVFQKGPLTKPYHAWVEKHLVSHDDIDQMILYPYPPNVQKRMDELKVENSERTLKYQSELNESCERRSRSNSLDKCELKPHVSSPSDHLLPLADQKPGVITWAKIMGQMWWPAMIIDFRDCGKKEPKFGCQWIIWYGDYTLSQVNHEFFIAFEKGVKRMKEYVMNCKREVYKKGVLDAAKDFCSQYGYKTDEWTIEDVFEWFSKVDDHDDESLSLRRIVLPGIPGNPETIQKYPPRIIEGLRKHKGNCTVAAIREHNIKDSKTLKSVFSGKSQLKTLCLMCLKNCNIEKEKWIDHPFFEGALCAECSEKYTPTIFAYGDDGKCFFCTVCAGSDTVVMCDQDDCPRVYCTACLKYLISPKSYNKIMVTDPFLCFLCRDSPDLLKSGLLKPRKDWRSRVAGLFHGNRDAVPNQVKYYDKNEKKKLRVLSLFDGISSGLVVLNKLGIQVEAYYASEIDPDAEMVSSAHFGHQIIRLGNVRSITEEKIREIAPIHLLIGGSPCNDLSLVNPARLGLHDPNGTGILVFEYQRIKNLINKANGETHFFWLFENVASMPSKYRLEINQHLGREPDLIDAANYSPQHRPRLYWNNFPSVSYPLSSQDLQDILTPNCNRHALVKKIRTVTTRTNSLKQGKLSLQPILMNKENDSLWITELEEIFGFPRHYTDVKNLSATKRQKLIGKSWSIQTIAELMRPLCNFFQGLNQDET